MNVDLRDGLGGRCVNATYRPLIRAVLLASLTVSLPTVISAQEPTVETEPLGEGMWLLRGGPGGNILVLDRAEGIVLVDAQSASVTEQVADAIARISTRPVRWVFSSHYHEDHIAGNVRFQAVGATIFGHANLARRASVDTVIDELEWHREVADPLALPQVSIAADTVVALSGVSLDVLAFENAHTDGDLAFFFSSFNVLHTGDIVEVDTYPFIDWWGGGSLDGTIQAVGTLIALTDAQTRVVPGTAMSSIAGISPSIGACWRRSDPA